MAHGPAHADAGDPFHRKVAISMSLFAVLLAFTTMMTNQARTQAILLANEAASRWNHYQAKSTRQAMARSTREILAQFPGAQAADSMGRLDADVARYEHEKAEIGRSAEGFRARARDHERREHRYEYASVGAELSIVLGSVALLLGSRVAFALGAAVALLAIALTSWTSLT